MSRRRRRSRGAAAVEYIIIVILVALAGAALTGNYSRTLRCKMTEAPGHTQECAGGGNVRLQTADDGCIGLVCTTGN